jgi:FkbM family methyltransferase
MGPAIDLPPSVRAVDTEVGRLFVDSGDSTLGKTLIKKGVYEPHWTAWLGGTVTPGMRVIDVGANLGYYSVLFGTRVGPAGRVVACEPEPLNRQLLARNLDAHGLADRVAIAAIALADKAGPMRLHRDPGFAGVHSLSAANRNAPHADDSIEVSAITLDQLVAQHRLDDLDFLKIDAQGAEGWILEGASRTLASARPLTLLIELWPAGLVNCGSSLERVLTLLGNAAFSGHMLHKREHTLRPYSNDAILDYGSKLAGRMSAFNVVFRRT